MAAIAGPAHARQVAEALADCQGPAPWRVLEAEAQALPEARAIWLDAQRLVWPGAPAAARARLLASPGPTLRTVPGEPAAGHTQAWWLEPDATPLPEAVTARHPHLRAALQGLRWRLPAEARPLPADAWRGALAVVLEDAEGRVLQATRTQLASALDDAYAAAAEDPAPLGATLDRARHPAGRTNFRLWAPTAQAVQLCLYTSDRSPAQAVQPLQRDARTGTWALTLPQDLRGRFYTYLVDVIVPGHGLVRQRVTDPYAISLGADSRRAWVGDLDDPRLMPPGWHQPPRLRPRTSLVDGAIYELHLRDFSVHDRTVPAAHRGRYGAFSVAGSAGMRHLRALARAGLSDVHLLPVFDLATVPEQGCVTPRVPAAAPDSPAQQAAVMASAARDCFNWGYDPLHFNAPEGSYASRADDGAARIVEFRRMVLALHRAGLRVGLDVVYNHLSAAGQSERSVLDRIVPGYYHRLDEAGRVTTSTCCANSATEHAMMGRLMLDSARLWARHYRIDSFRFDLMGHQPRAAMERLRDLLRQDRGHDVPLLGEGWNFGEVADGARFVQASQASLGGSGIATFSDRGRDALRGGGHGDDGAAMVARKGWLNGAADPALADLVRLSLAGTLKGYRFTSADGTPRRGDELRYAGQPAGYAEQPGEVVNYVENHDNQTLWDLHAFKLPPGTPSVERARAQVLGLAVTALSQGIPYFHAGVDLLRSKSMDVNSYDSGDWFNRIDWEGRRNFFGSGLPPAGDNGALHALMAPRLRDASNRATPADIAYARQALRDWLAVRAATPVLRLRSADEVQRRLVFHDATLPQGERVIVAELDGRGLGGPARVLLVLNADEQAQTLELPVLARGQWRLHPVLAAARAADRRLHGARVGEGRVQVPGRSASVWLGAW